MLALKELTCTKTLLHETNGHDSSRARCVCNGRCSATNCYAMNDDQCARFCRSMQTQSMRAVFRGCDPGACALRRHDQAAVQGLVPELSAVYVTLNRPST